MAQIDAVSINKQMEQGRRKRKFASQEKKHRELKKGEFWKKIPAYVNVPEEKFNNHHWQLRNSITSVKKLLSTVRDLIDEDFLKDAQEGFSQAPMAVRVTPYVLSLIDWENPYDDPLRRQYIPVLSRLKKDHPELHLDTLNERGDSPVLGLTHRYPDKVLLLALDHCPVYCRYCTRSYAVGFNTENVEKMKLGQSEERLKKIFDYLEKHPAVEDVVISGGDASMLKPGRLKWIGETLLQIPHIRRIRYATKGPAIIPQKILSDHEWYDALKAVNEMGRRLHKEVCVHTHFSHPNEITDISRRAMGRFMEDGIAVRNQAVLQRGVNDSRETMALLTKRLSFINVQPYYVYMHDLVRGVEDLRTTLDSGIRIEKWVRGITAGFNTPTFVVDAPGGGGKRSIHSYEHYDRETGISIYTAPGIKPGKYFFYYDPIDSLSPEVQKAWHSKEGREEMKQAALEKARHGRHVDMPGSN